MIAEIGIWRNLVTPDEAVRKAHLRVAAECLAVADEVGAKLRGELHRHATLQAPTTRRIRRTSPPKRSTTAWRRRGV